MKIGLFFELLSLFEPFHRVADGVLVWACSLFVRAAYSFISGHNYFAMLGAENSHEFEESHFLERPLPFGNFGGSRVAG